MSAVVATQAPRPPPEVKRAVKCTKSLSCGCICTGVAGEKEHPGCLKCAGKGGLLCPICLDTLDSQANIMLSCYHRFHAKCVQDLIKARWPDARISFDYLCCPICKVEIKHECLKPYLRPAHKLKAQVEKLAINRLRYEMLDTHTKLTDPKSPFYKNPTKFAMEYFLFYGCHKCDSPYFAGQRECMEAGTDFNPRDLICPSCQNVQDCPKHGKEWVAFKCRFCCNVSSWYCWGNTHFCTSCHRDGRWQKYVEHRSGKNKMELWEYEQCPGIQAQIDKLPKDISLEQKRKVCKEMISKSSMCPLRISHPINGLRFALGCMICNSSPIPTSCEIKENQKKSEEKKEKIARATAKDAILALNALKPEGKSFLHTSDFDDKGIFHYLGTAGGTLGWSNPCLLGMVSVTASALMRDSKPEHYAVGREVVRCVTTPKLNSWFYFRVLQAEIRPTHYTLRHYSSWNTECLRNWTFEGSKDGVTWHILRNHFDDAGIPLRKGGTCTWKISGANSQRFYSHFKLRITGKNSNSNYYLPVSGFEVYGTLRKITQFSTPSEPKPNSEAKDLQIAGEEEAKDIFRREFVSGMALFGTGGIVYAVGTDFGKRKWRNPVESGDIVITSSNLGSRSEPNSALVGKATLRWVTAPSKNAYFELHFKSLQIRPSYYALKHYASWDSEALRNWRLEAMPYKSDTWIVLSEHRNDISLEGKGCVAGFSLSNHETLPYCNRFRLVHIYLHTSVYIYIYMCVCVCVYIYIL
ncbi:hypothetical protein AAMO2058_000765200 [Amorphochlora amoebiformis]